MTVTIAELRAALTAFGFFGPEWRAILIDPEKRAPRSVADAERELAAFVERASGFHSFRAAKTCGPEAVDEALRLLRSMKILSAKRPCQKPVPYARPASNYLARLHELFA